ncbi:MAG: hypothetical protein ABSF82_01895 [Candidatus Bathyarchaeia archaeon]
METPLFISEMDLIIHKSANYLMFTLVKTTKEFSCGPHCGL